MKNQTLEVAKINNIALLVHEGPDELVPIKPICQILGIAHQPQFEKIKNDPVLKNSWHSIVSTGNDGKQYKMLSLPKKFLYGWLFSINHNNVSPEIQESLIKYKWECYYALYEKFELQSSYLQEMEERKNRAIQQQKVLRKNFNSARSELNKNIQQLNELSEYTFEKWKNSGQQLTMFDEAPNVNDVNDSSEDFVDFEIEE